MFLCWVFEVNTDLQKNILSKVSAELSWPSLLSSPRFVIHLWVSVGRGQGRGQGPHGPLSTPGLLGDGSQDSEGPGWGLSEGGRGEAGPWCLRHQGWTWVPPAGPGEA